MRRRPFMPFEDEVRAYEEALRRYEEWRYVYGDPMDDATLRRFFGPPPVDPRSRLSS